MIVILDFYSINSYIIPERILREKVSPARIVLIILTFSTYPTVTRIHVKVT